jgi:DNA-binding NarL/FixJ family response regulator
MMKGGADRPLARARFSASAVAGLGGAYLAPIEGSADISLGYYRGPLDAVLVGHQRARLDGAILELDGTAEELHDLVDARTAARPDLAEANRRVRHGRFRLGPIEFGAGRPLRLPIEGDALAQLLELLERHADPEIAIELLVRDSDGYLIEAYDVGDNDIFVSSRLPEASTAALRAALGEHLRPPKD